MPSFLHGLLLSATTLTWLGLSHWSSSSSSSSASANPALPVQRLDVEVCRMKIYTHEDEANYGIFHATPYLGLSTDGVTYSPHFAIARPTFFYGVFTLFAPQASAAPRPQESPGLDATVSVLFCYDRECHRHEVLDTATVTFPPDSPTRLVKFARTIGESGFLAAQFNSTECGSGLGIVGEIEYEDTEPSTLSPTPGPREEGGGCFTCSLSHATTVWTSDRPPPTVEMKEFSMGFYVNAFGENESLIASGTELHEIQLVSEVDTTSACAAGGTCVFQDNGGAMPEFCVDVPVGTFTIGLKAIGASSGDLDENDPLPIAVVNDTDPNGFVYMQQHFDPSDPARSFSVPLQHGELLTVNCGEMNPGQNCFASGFASFEVLPF